jgi:hypothetical protein
VCCATVPCKAIFVDNVGAQFPGQTAIEIDDNTFVFAATSGGWTKMVAVNNAGKQIEARYMSPGNALTAANWAAANVQTLGYYNVSNVEFCPGISSACTDCPANSISPVGSTVSTSCQCNTGYTGADGGTCTACLASTYKTGVGSATCSACPASSVSPVGSTLSTSCQCNAGFYSTYFRFYSTSLDWASARQRCVDLGGNLAYPANQAQQDLLWSMAGVSAWIGVDDRTSEGSWRTPGGQAISYSRWCSGEPNDFGGNEDCGIVGGGCWNDYGCHNSLPYLCQMPAVSACTPCQAGSYSNASAAGSCVSCELGKYVNVTGATACLQCATNATSTADGRSCACLPGFGGDGRVHCSACAAGTYWADTGKNCAVACVRAAVRACVLSCVQVCQREVSCTLILPE